MVPNKYQNTCSREVKFGQMFVSVRRCAEIMTQLRRQKVKVTVKGHGI